VNKKGCDELNYSKCCFQTGQAYLYGRGVEKNYDKAVKYYNKGCTETKANHAKDIGLSCQLAGQLALGLFGSETDIKAVRPTEGVQFLEKACEVGMLDSCEILHQVLLKGMASVPKDEKKALSLAEKCCDLDSLPGCYAAYDMHRKGIGTEKNTDKASKYKKKLKDLEEQMSVASTMGMYT